MASLETVVRRGIWPTLAVAARLWPTARANDARDGGWQRSGAAVYETLPGAAGGAGGPGGAPWPERPVEAWERDVPRTIDPKACPDRRPRLRTLGNAVVPLVAEVVGMVVLAIDEALGAPLTVAAK